jgi:hypothetical protein
MNKFLIFYLCLFFLVNQTKSQSVAINSTGLTADASAMLDVTSTTKGILIPRLTTTERTAITTPATGLMVYDITLAQFYYYNGTAWTAISFGANANNYWTLSGSNLYNNIGTSVGIGLTTPAANLDVTGTSSSTNSLLLRSGNTSVSTISNQILLGFNNSTNFKHAIKSRHNSGTNINNAIDFYVWQASDGAATTGTKHVLTLEGTGFAGFGTTSPTSQVHVSGGNFLVTGTFGSSATIEPSGAGTRLFFNPRKAAFRPGNISSTQWNDASIGNYSFASGQNTVASGSYSTSMGSSDTASADYAVAIGQGNKARTSYSVTIGDANTAETNSFAVAIGRQNHSAGFASLAMGHFSEATGDYSSSIGLRDTVSGFGASSVGSYNKVTSTYGFAANYNNIVSGVNSAAFGNTNVITGSNNIVGGVSSRAEFDHSIVVGNSDTSQASATAVFGSRNKVTGFAGFAANDNNKATASSATAFGFTNIASGDQAFVNGVGNTSPSFAETVVGTYATNYTAIGITTINTTDRLFTVGNGTTSSSRSDAFTIIKNGNTGIGSNTPTSKLTVNGSIAAATIITAGSLTLDGTHYCVIYTGAAGNTLTLPTASTCVGRIYVLVNHGTDVLTTSIYKIGNATTSTSIAIDTNVQLISDGIEWRKIN